MNDITVKRIEDALTASYSVQSYIEFVQEVFDGVKLIAPNIQVPEFTNFSYYIQSYTHVGEYTTSDKKKVLIFAVELKNKSNVENARSTQRSYAKKLIETSGCDAALIAFYTEGNPKWRLSFVRLDYEIKFENGRMKAAENITPAKRYSYLVGQDEPCHTAISQFRKFITGKSTPVLDDLEEAFSVETVTNEFFALYCEKFHQLVELLDKNEDFQIESTRHNFNAAQFAKKLMGQIVFLYFLQKKGWLGVNAWPKSMTEKEYRVAFYARGAKSRELIPQIYRVGEDGLYHLVAANFKNISEADEALLAPCVKGEPWGTGPRNFMRRLFDFSEKRNANFFDDYLEPLFYNALNVNRGEQGYDPVLKCRIPFLSGGLFDPIDGYEWEHNHFGLPNSLFSNRQENNTRTGDGILDIFDRYNFTMSEDEPLEKEVAIDPEMLGKVFENLLEIKDRKSKGAFYTPREVVHYMCQEALIEYLTSNMNLEESAIRDFILYGDFMKDEDTVKEKRSGNGGMFISESLYKLDSSGKVVVNRLLDMDSALANVRVADPAVGSGAFPLGMLNEIVRARQNISAYLAITMNNYDKHMMYQLDRSPHALKYETIRNCIFAADIEPSAVDIAQLRLWLSLVIDDEINPDAQSELDGHRNPLPLPNLECNILCGNSLMDEFEGIALINESELLHNTNTGSQLDFNGARFDSILTQLIQKQDDLFRCDNTERKRQLKEDIETLKDAIIHSQLVGCLPETLTRYNESKKQASRPYVLWQLDFARVFREKGGFDIIIGNPPYVQVPKGTVNKNRFSYSEGKDKGKQNLYKIFIEHGYNLAKKDGCVIMIVQSSLMCDLSSMHTRQLLLERTQIKKFIEFPKKSSDTKGQVFDSVLQGTCICHFVKSMPSENMSFAISIGNNTKTIDRLRFDFIEQNLIEKIYPESFYIPLIRPGEFSIMSKIFQKSDILLSYMDSISQGDLNLTGAKSKFSHNQTPVLLLRGRHIGRYYIHNDSDEYVDVGYLSDKVDRNRKNTYLVGQEITGTVDEWRLHFALTEMTYSFLFGHTSNKILLKDQNLNYFILGIINSKIEDWFYRKTSTNNHVMGYELKQLPVVHATPKDIECITQLVKKIVACAKKDEDYSVLADEVNKKIYDLYGLTQSEVDLIEA